MVEEMDNRSRLDLYYHVNKMLYSGLQDLDIMITIKLWSHCEKSGIAENIYILRGIPRVFII